MSRSLPPDSSTNWPSVKAKQVLAALLRIGWRIKRQSGSSHRILERTGWPDILFAYHDRVTLGPAAMKVLARKTGLRREDL
jgi:predicted RNA binding protein YcfA (HicA-like mRNA interferase family)